MVQICDLPLVVVDPKESSSPMQARCVRELAVDELLTTVVENRTNNHQQLSEN